MIRKIFSLIVLIALFTGCTPALSSPEPDSVPVQDLSSLPIFDNQPASVPTVTFTLTAPDLPADGRLPVEFTCVGDGSTLHLAWSGAPAETQSYAVIRQNNNKLT